jgi:hypothetical protein
LKRNKTSTSNGTDDDRQVEQIVFFIAFTTLQLLFREDNDTTGGSNNETDGIAYGSTLYAGGDVDWQTRIRTWFRTEFLGELNFIIFLVLTD